MGRFGTGAGFARGDKFGDVLSHAIPSIVSGDQLDGLVDSKVTTKEGVMMVLHDC